jgi:hypothetical protein
MTKKLLIAVIFFLSFLFGTVVIAQNSKDHIPYIKKNENGTYSFLVDGKPFIVLGAQLWNSSNWPYILDNTWSVLKEMHCNTLEAPVYWQVMEPSPGQYRFDEVDSLVYGAREHGLKLVLLWFGSYKNGSSSYAPSWVLEQTQKFPRVQNAAGEQLQILSPISTSNLEADQKAFAALMKHLKQIDSRDHTVIMMQVENESGFLGTDRDYSSEANKVFADQVPASLVQKLNKKNGSWKEVFGNDAAESFSAYYVASYINQIATAGQKEFGLIMYVNDWLKENSFQRPGEYPSGGATSTMLPIWKAVAPAISFQSPDIYIPNVDVFRNLCDEYSHPDNPFFIPEMGKGMDFARYQFYALADYHAFGVATYGVDFYLTDPYDERIKTGLDKKYAAIANNYRLLAGALPELAKLQSENKLKAVGEEYGLQEQLISIGDYDILFNYGYPAYKTDKSLSGRAFVGQLGDDELLIIGFDCKFHIRPKYNSGYNRAEYTAIEEGYFENGKWIRKRIWNGDEAYHSTLTSEGNILKIKFQKIK